MNILTCNARRSFVTIVLCVALTLSTATFSQARGPYERRHAPSKELILSTSFSPDGATLAICRGVRDATRQSGRIELWDTGTGKLRQVIKGFDGPVWSVSFSPDGGTIVSASSELHDRKIQEKPGNRNAITYGELKWWDARTGEFKQKIRVSEDSRLSVVAHYSPDGKALAIVENYFQVGVSMGYNPYDSQGSSSLPLHAVLRPGAFSFNVDLKLVDSHTGAVINKLRRGYTGVQFGGLGFLDPTRSLAGGRLQAIFSPDGQILAEWTPFELKFWAVNNGREVRKIKISRGILNAIAFSPDGRMVACAVLGRDSGSWKRQKPPAPGTEVRLYDVTTGELTRETTFPTDVINSLAFSLTGRVLIFGTRQFEADRTFGTIKLWDLKTGTMASINAGNDRSVYSLLVSPDGGSLAIQTGPSAVELLDPKTWSVKYIFDSDSENKFESKAVSRYLLSVKSILTAEFSPDGRAISGAIEGGEIKVWDPRTGEVKKELSDREGASLFVTLSRDGRTLAETEGNEFIRLWDVPNGVEREFETPAGRTVTAVGLSPNGSLLAIGVGAEVLLRESSTGKLLKTLNLRQSTVNFVTFSNDGKFLATADENGTIDVWDLGSGQTIHTLNGNGKVNALRFAPDSRTLATANADNSISLLELYSGRQLQRLKKHGAPVNAIAFSPDGLLLASGGEDKMVIIWETSSGKSKRTLKGHDLTVTSVAFSPDGQLIASGCGNASVVLWNVNNGTLERVLR